MLNPFRSRHSDTPGEHAQFARTFAPQVLQYLPAHPWTQLLVIRSAPGAGKTSLMKALSADTLSWIVRNGTVVRPTFDALSDFGAIVGDRPHLLGVRVSLKYDFLSLADVGEDQKYQLRIFNRLLDARIIGALVRGALAVAGKPLTAAATFELIPGSDSSKVATAFSRLGGTTGSALLHESYVAESEILDLLDRLIARGQQLPGGHQHIYSLQALSNATIRIDGQVLDVLPVVMLDEGQTLAPQQREALLVELSDRETTVARWLGVQSRAMSDRELIGAGQQGRDYSVIELESFSRDRTGKVDSNAPAQRMTAPRYRAMLIEIADKRGNLAVSRLVDSGARFSEYFATDGDEDLTSRLDDVAADLRNELRNKVGLKHRYEQWLQGIDDLRGRDGVAQLAEIAVLIERDQTRAQQELFTDSLSLPSDAIAKRGDSVLREAAFLGVANRFKLPYYHGANAITRLASSNIEQFLELCGDFYAHLQVRASANKPVVLDASTQDKIVREASNRYWNQLDRLPDGPLVQRLVERIADLAAVEATKPTIPYPPGVTGTAMSMSDRQRIIDPKERLRMPGSEELRRALTSAIAHNVVWIEPDYSVKGDRWMVIYLNRLICPRFRMPLTLGAFREKRLHTMAGWFADVAAEQGTLL
jgi:hypothetical protein